MDLLEKLKSGNNVYGTAFTSIAPSWPIHLQKAGLDFVFLDTEHIALDRSDLSRLCQQFTALGITPIVRIYSSEPASALAGLVTQAIDAGAIGVVAPYLESTEQIRALVGAVKYKPLKGEVLDSVLKEDGKYSLNDDMQQYLRKQNGHKLAIANIESVPSMEKLDELLSVKGLDGVFIGPHDLSCSLGVPEMYDHPIFVDSVRTIVKTARGKGLAIGIHFSLEPERQVYWVKEGCNMIVHSFDIALFSQRLHHDMQVIRRGVGDRSEATEKEMEAVTI